MYVAVSHLHLKDLTFSLQLDQYQLPDDAVVIEKWGRISLKTGKNKDTILKDIKNLTLPTSTSSDYPTVYYAEGRWQLYTVFFEPSSEDHSFENLSKLLPPPRKTNIGSSGTLPPQSQFIATTPPAIIVSAPTDDSTGFASVRA